MLLKNTDLSPVDCEGRMLPVGDTADLDATRPVIDDHIQSGRLTPVTSPHPNPARAARHPSKES